MLNLQAHTGAGLLERAQLVFGVQGAVGKIKQFESQVAVDRQALAQYCEAVSDYRRWTLKIQELNASLATPGGGDVQTYRTGAKDLSVWRKLRNDAERRADAAGAKFVARVSPSTEEHVNDRGARSVPDTQR